MIITPLNHRYIQLALKTLLKNKIIDRIVRTLFIKTGKRLDKQQFELANIKRELRSLKRKLANIKTKSKKKQAVNPNKLFIELSDILGALDGPSAPICAATVT